MKTFLRRGSGRLAGLLGSTGALGLIAAPLQAWAGPWYQPYGYPQPLPTVPGPSAYGGGYGYGSGYRADYDTNRYRAAVPVDPAYIQAQNEQSCTVGRVVGGIIGGGIGYAASRREGRAWAVPLGALVGQQLGCNIGAQRPPLSW
jgi:hypothetical protein